MKNAKSCQATIQRMNPGPSPHPASLQGVSHYENFPVATVLCPPHLRPAIAAIYLFARPADDIADEGDALPPTRLDTLSPSPAGAPPWS